jgi:hypothetical protein
MTAPPAHHQPRKSGALRRAGVAALQGAADNRHQSGGQPDFSKTRQNTQNEYEAAI